MIMMLWVYTAIKIIIIKILIIIENENGLFRSSVSVLGFFFAWHISSAYKHTSVEWKKKWMRWYDFFVCVPLTETRSEMERENGRERGGGKSNLYISAHSTASSVM